MSAFLFWVSALLIIYTYILYPLGAWVFGRILGRTPMLEYTTPDLTVIVAAYNEASRIRARIDNILAQDYPADRLQVIVVSDGSSDGTEGLARRDDPRVRVLHKITNVGKAAAIDLAMEQAKTDLVVFTDARQRFTAGTLRELVAPFADPGVGAVTGELLLEAAPGPEGAMLKSMGLYWRMEKALREAEARLGVLHGVTGAVYALRRKLFKSIPHGTILDDIYIPIQIIKAGKTVWMAREAYAYDDISQSPSEEFRRKLRTLAGNWQLIFKPPFLLDARRNPVFAAWFSHKFLRLIVPWALIAALPTSFAAGPAYRTAFYLQLLAWILAVVALAAPKVHARVPGLSIFGTFAVLNAAALLSLPAYFMLDVRGLWKKR